MKLPLSLIQSFIELDMSAETIGDTLTLLGLEVDYIHPGPVFEISLTPNLGHCMSALGVARELSAALQLPIKETRHPIQVRPLKMDVKIKDAKLIPHYMCYLIEDVVVGPSPTWLKNILESAGQKSINNVVDVTNYISMKFGQPLHAFDYDKIEGKRLEIGPSHEVHSILCLDGETRDVPAGSILISDGKKPIAIAGIMGAANSQVTDTTTKIFLEAAFFDPISIRNTAKKIALRTESAQKFEKGIDPNGLERALQEAAILIGATFSGSVECKAKEFLPKKINYRPDRVNQILGTKLSQNEMEAIFKRLQFKVVGNCVEVPTYRSDLHEEIDLIEEIARIYGYNNIEKTTPTCTISELPSDPMFLFENEMRKTLTGLGLFEFLTCDLISPELAEIGKQITPPSMGLLQSCYSKSEEYSILRTSLLPALLQVTKQNFAQKNHHFGAFEIGRIHFQQVEKVVEIPMLALLLTGHKNPIHWSEKPQEVDFFDLKGMIEHLVNGQFEPSNHISFHPGRQADIHIDNLIVGSFGEIHPQLLDEFDIKQRVYYAEINLTSLLSKKRSHHKMAQLPQFPASERDWTVPLDKTVEIKTIFNAIHSLKSPLLEKVELIDLYMPEDAMKKNATLHFIYRDASKTILFEEVEREHTKIIDHVMNILAK